MTKFVLLTGLPGLIAKHCALVFLKAGYGVRGTVRRLDCSSEVRQALCAYLTPLELSRSSFMRTDLEQKAGWHEAMQGMDAVIHTASPFPFARPRNADELIRPAVESTRRVLEAAARAGVLRISSRRLRSRFSTSRSTGLRTRVTGATSIRRASRHMPAPRPLRSAPPGRWPTKRDFG